jgi:hypothetical protein
VTARQVTEALAVRLPSVVLPFGQAARPTMVRLAVTVDATGVRIDLADPDGTPLLHRVIAAAHAPAECAALADTIALIIERYWREVDAPAVQTPAPPPPAPPPAAAPPPAPPPSVTPAISVEKTAPPVRAGAATAAVPLRLAAAAAVAARAGDSGASLMVAFAAEARFGVRLSAGISTGTTEALTVGGQPAGEAAFRRYPLRLGAYLPIHIGLGQLEPGVGVDLDLISVSLPGNGTKLDDPSPCAGGLCRSPGADLALGWSVASTHHVYARALARAAITAPYDFVTKSDPVWRTPSTYLEVAVESGLWFP